MSSYAVPGNLHSPRQTRCGGFFRVLPSAKTRHDVGLGQSIHKMQRPSRSFW
jgi:hypothetical protein